ncbi:MAG: type II toxin-antitoxin system PemK/MazF family toxin [Rhodocyclaceae bacterium]|nr:type II toxin-antitoxin system PemK/MazF family toxin [Rhodocyclaceae bacterium]
MANAAYDFGEVVLVPFPFTDQSGGKKRPALVVSSAAYSAHRPDLLIMAVTSQPHAALDFGSFPIADWQAAGLLKPSLAKPILTTLESGLVIRRMGRLSPRDQESLRLALSSMLG